MDSRPEGKTASKANQAQKKGMKISLVSHQNLTFQATELN